jgi:hypothetical protein
MTVPSMRSSKAASWAGDKRVTASPKTRSAAADEGWIRAAKCASPFRALTTSPRALQKARRSSGFFTALLEAAAAT